ncbi:hypothetical protein EV196_108262 [Mariniflexile fucanivorans]|uniref:Uncharacterized protein n=1 Tax=Mariniflexile fucanivorans TaxID=264023 RepID=A0A4R1RDW8_9FLAO|nr:hypothetical protein EV196_108262 [Mariniflexile fucanivorans]
MNLIDEADVMRIVVFNMFRVSKSLINYQLTIP